MPGHKMKNGMKKTRGNATMMKKNGNGSAMKKNGNGKNGNGKAMNGLTAAQKKLPPALQKAILIKKGKK